MLAANVLIIKVLESSLSPEVIFLFTVQDYQVHSSIFHAVYRKYV